MQCYVFYINFFIVIIVIITYNNSIFKMSTCTWKTRQKTSKTVQNAEQVDMRVENIGSKCEIFETRGIRNMGFQCISIWNISMNQDCHIVTIIYLPDHIWFWKIGFS